MGKFLTLKKDAKISDLDKIHKLVIEGIENACNEGSLLRDILYPSNVII